MEQEKIEETEKILTIDLEEEEEGEQEKNIENPNLVKDVVEEVENIENSNLVKEVAEEIENIKNVDFEEIEATEHESFESVDSVQEEMENDEDFDKSPEYPEDSSEEENEDNDDDDDDDDEDEIRIKIERPSSDEEGTVELKVLESNVPIDYDSDAEDVEEMEVFEPSSPETDAAEISDEDEEDPYILAERDTRRLLLEKMRKKLKEKEKIPPDQLLVFKNVKVKDEPVDEISEPSLTYFTKTDTTKVSVKSTIDGNFDLDKNVSIVPKNAKIKINITKPVKQVSKKETRSKVAGESKLVARTVPLIPAAIKPTLQRKKLQIMPTVHKGEELSSLCAIM